jgi:glutamate-ammonia-ligase adenylyltransferase
MLTSSFAALAAFSPMLAARLREPGQEQSLPALASHPIDAARIKGLWQALIAAEARWQSDDAGQVARLLRRLRGQVVSGLALRDLSGLAPLDEVEAAMTALAELALAALLPPLRAEATRRYGELNSNDAKPLDLLVIGMGKLGAGELNVSSDIDVVFAIGEHGTTERDIDALEFFAHVTQRLTGLLSEVTPDGFVFRVDTRLRPFGDVGPRVISLDALEHYFMAHGRFWERCAWLKARIVNPPLAMTASDFDAVRERLAAMIKSFVFRRYTDYTTIDGLRDLSARIATQRRSARHHAAFGDADVKLGRGGIREIEFIAQGLAIMHGGRIAALQTSATRILLTRLASTGKLDTDCARTLDQAYVLLRRIEHAVQYRNDAQTHAIPSDIVVRAQMALLLGFESLDQFDQVVETTRNQVANLFDQLLPAPAGSRSTQLGARGDTLSARLAPWLTAANRESEATQKRLETVLLAFDARLPDDAAFNRAAQLAQTIMRRRTYLDLLISHPPVVDRVARLMAASPFAADYLTRHPILLDEMIDPGLGQRGIDWPAFDAELREQLDRDTDTERRMNVLRDQHHAQVLRILALDLAGATAVESISDELSLLADKLLAAAIACAWQVLGQNRPAPAFAVIAYGRLGAKEMGYTSDLDLVFVHQADNDDDKELVTRWAQRLQSWLTVQTTSGRLFEVDLRLRPNGNAGLLVTGWQAYRDYLSGAALWELQALTRARFCVGNSALGGQFESFRRELLAMPREWSAVALEVAAMRKRVLDGHPNQTAHFDIKHDPGGLVDMEFAVQSLVLAHSHRLPQLLDDVGTLALALRAADADLVNRTIADAARNAYRSLRGLQHSTRLAGADIARLDPSMTQPQRTAIRGFVEALGLAFPTSRK